MGTMAVEERNEWWAPKDNVCYLCAELVPFTQGAVFWDGAPSPTRPDPRLIFHPDCAEHLAMALIADAREVRLLSDEEPWKHRMAAFIKTLMVRREHRVE